ncbi:DUF5683 domain-containing protein [Haloflavibacter putidus]|uniref:DUF5683 domain-containing protein n=1 Tax=Haloflavibacter putidus TaxID=2576776 RepID=A0A507ZKF0_9FLAO|nr:DUF5683 domain-containing protein [Haloflavibacter putidus]TQD35415.1 hypothetical protein FKR84_11130 [Haloflavibacter putidus]
MNNKLLPFILSLVFCCSLLAQERDTLTVKNRNSIPSEKLQQKEVYNPLSPAKAAFYSAVLPGLGQAYNGSYWKIPLVYGALGAGVYFIVDNNNEYHRYRDAYKRRLAGYEDDEFMGVLSTKSLIEAQKQFRRNKELSMLITVGIYVLNIIEANVDAHLSQFNVSEDLSFEPNMEFDEISGSANYGLVFKLKL